MTVARVVTRGEMFDDCGCANKTLLIFFLNKCGGTPNLHNLIYDGQGHFTEEEY